MEIKTNERKLIYYPIEKDEIIERNLDDFIVFMMSDKFKYRNDICAFFGIVNTTYFYDDGPGSDYPHINSHVAEKDNLLKELIEDELVIPRSSKTFYLHPDLFDSDDDEPEHCQMDCTFCQNYYAGLCSDCDGSNMYYEGAD